MNLKCLPLENKNKTKKGEQNVPRKVSERTRQVLEEHSLANKTPEEKHKFAMMGVEAKRKKKEQTMALQNCMRSLLKMRPNSDKAKRVLKEFGFTDEEVTNKSILMVALFKKGLTGDVGAIREITDMMDKLDMVEAGKNVTGQTININLVPVGSTYQQSDEVEEDIWKAENGILDEEEDEEWNTDDEDWGEDTYDG